MATLRNVNLNMLPVLHRLLLHKNITRAGRDLNMSQSAVSDALAKLRLTFKDELLVRKGRGMELTGFAQSLVPQLQQAINNIESLFSVQEFDPIDLTRKFVVACTDLSVVAVGPLLVATMSKLAPKSSVQFLSLCDSTMGDSLSGSIDVVIAPQEVVPAGFIHADLYQDRFVCIMRKDHPLATTRLTLDNYLSTPHASFRPDRLSETTMEAQFLRIAGRSQFEVVRVAQFSLLPYFVTTTDCIALITEGLARRLQAEHGFIIKDLPFTSESFTMSLWWPEMSHHNIEHRWFRQTLLSLTLETTKPNCVAS